MRRQQNHKQHGVCDLTSQSSHMAQQAADCDLTREDGTRIRVEVVGKSCLRVQVLRPRDSGNCQLFTSTLCVSCDVQSHRSPRRIAEMLRLGFEGKTEVLRLSMKYHEEDSSLCGESHDLSQQQLQQCHRHPFCRLELRYRTRFDDELISILLPCVVPSPEKDWGIGNDDGFSASSTNIKTAVNPTWVETASHEDRSNGKAVEKKAVMIDAKSRTPCTKSGDGVDDGIKRAKGKDRMDSLQKEEERKEEGEGGILTESMKEKRPQYAEEEGMEGGLRRTLPKCTDRPAEIGEEEDRATSNERKLGKTKPNDEENVQEPREENREENEETTGEAGATQQDFRLNEDPVVLDKKKKKTDKTGAEDVKNPGTIAAEASSRRWEASEGRAGGQAQQSLKIPPGKKPNQTVQAGENPADEADPIRVLPTTKKNKKKKKGKRKKKNKARSNNQQPTAEKPTVRLSSTSRTPALKPFSRSLVISKYFKENACELAQWTREEPKNGINSFAVEGKGGGGGGGESRRRRAHGSNKVKEEDEGDDDEDGNLEEDHSHCGEDGIVAKRKFQAGETVLAPSALATIPTKDCKTEICHSCLKFSPRMLFRCEGCNYARFCSTQCMVASRREHNEECAALRCLMNCGLITRGGEEVGEQPCVDGKKGGGGNVDEEILVMLVKILAVRKVQESRKNLRVYGERKSGGGGGGYRKICLSTAKGAQVEEFFELAVSDSIDEKGNNNAAAGAAGAARDDKLRAEQRFYTSLCAYVEGYLLPILSKTDLASNEDSAEFLAKMILRVQKYMLSVTLPDGEESGAKSIVNVLPYLTHDCDPNCHLSFCEATAGAGGGARCGIQLVALREICELEPLTVSFVDVTRVRKTREEHLAKVTHAVNTLVPCTCSRCQREMAVAATGCASSKRHVGKNAGKSDCSNISSGSHLSGGEVSEAMEACISMVQQGDIEQAILQLESRLFDAADASLSYSSIPLLENQLQQSTDISTYYRLGSSGNSGNSSGVSSSPTSSESEAMLDARLLYLTLCKSSDVGRVVRIRKAAMGLISLLEARKTPMCPRLASTYLELGESLVACEEKNDKNEDDYMQRRRVGLMMLQRALNMRLLMFGSSHPSTKVIKKRLVALFGAKKSHNKKRKSRAKRSNHR
eukprot:jgi/Bigna1/68204/fgenesh1_pg.5_\